MSAEWGKGQQRPGAGRPYAQPAERLAPVRRVAMPRATRLYAPDATVHVVARCSNREFAVTAPEDFAAVLGKLRGIVRDDELTLLAWPCLAPPGSWPATPIRRWAAPTAVGPRSAPWAAMRFWRDTGAAAAVPGQRPRPGKINKMDAKRCPVPFHMASPISRG
jgi:hypothetical protein